MSEKPECPKCSSHDLLVERRPNGDARCLTCKWEGLYKKCFKSSTQQLGELIEEAGMKVTVTGWKAELIEMEKKYDALKKEFAAEQAEMAKVKEQRDVYKECMEDQKIALSLLREACELYKEQLKKVCARVDIYEKCLKKAAETPVPLGKVFDHQSWARDLLMDGEKLK